MLKINLYLKADVVSFQQPYLRMLFGRFLPNRQSRSSLRSFLFVRNRLKNHLEYIVC